MCLWPVIYFLRISSGFTGIPEISVIAPRGKASSFLCFKQTIFIRYLIPSPSNICFYCEIYCESYRKSSQIRRQAAEGRDLLNVENQIISLLKLFPVWRSAVSGNQTLTEATDSNRMNSLLSRTFEHS